MWHHKNKFILFLAGCLFLSASCHGQSLYSYGTKIDFSDRYLKKLPDLNIRFLGKREMATSDFRPGFTYYDFEVSKNGKTRTISWSSGTGDIGPEYFEIEGETFVLELAWSQAFKNKIEKGKMVIWKKTEYEDLCRKSFSR